MANEFFSTSVLSEYTKEERELLKTIAENAKNFLLVLNKVDKKSIESVKKMAHISAINAISDKVFSVFKRHFIEAIIKSVEYNHELFVNQTLRALEAHQNELISIIPDGEPGKIFVNLNMNVLGTIDEYAAAVEMTREELGIAKIPDANIRSVIWAEKIYGVAREGVRVTKLNTDELEEEDITDRYEGLWERTITTRLSFLDPLSAPWWYILNYGNINLRFSEGDEGIPYPTIEPTYFLDNIVIEINNLFYAYYNNAFKSTFTKFGEVLAKETDDFVSKYIETITNYDPSKGMKTLNTLEYNDKIWELYITSRGRVGLRYSLQNLRR